MNLTLEDSQRQNILDNLQKANSTFKQNFPEDSGQRQPVHTVYGGAHLFKSGLANKLGMLANRSLDGYAPNFVILTQALQLPGYKELPTTEDAIDKLVSDIEKNENKYKKEQSDVHLAYIIYKRVREKLVAQSVEDFRIDFEDGYGNRVDSEEDEHAIQAAEQVAIGMKENTLPPFIGIRIKPFTEELKKRGLRTLDLFVTKLSELTNGKLPKNFVVTLPKVTIPEQVENLVHTFKLLEEKLNLEPNSLKLELMIETIQSIINETGVFTIPTLVKATEGRCRGCHFGTYDYTATCNITATYQTMTHDACNFAKHVMQVALGGRNIMISDGATTTMPIGPHRVPKDGPPLTELQHKENIEAVHSAWKLHFDNIMHSLKHGFYQGWDLNPAQLPIRYATLYYFFLSSLNDVSVRLSNFIKQAAQATLSGNAFDDAATGQGLLNYFLRALNCGAISLNEVQNTGLSIKEIQSKSFVSIVEGRR